MKLLWGKIKKWNKCSSLCWVNCSLFLGCFFCSTDMEVHISEATFL